MTTVQHHVIHRALSYPDVLGEVDLKYFSGICYDTVKAMKQVSELTAENLRTYINESTLINKRDILEYIGKVESTVYAWSDSFIAELKKEWFKRESDGAINKLSKYGTDECTHENAGAIIDNLEKIYQETTDTGELENYTKTFAEFLSLSETDIHSERLYIDHPVLKLYYDYLMPRIYVITGFPGMGKNIVLDNLVVNLSKKHNGLYFCFDNSRLETTLSLMSIKSGVPYKKLQDHDFDTASMDKIAAAESLINGKVLMYDKITTAGQICNLTRKAVQTHGIKYACLDYFQNIKLMGHDAVRGFEDAVLSIKQVSNELRIPFIILSQVNNDGEMKWCKGLLQESYHVLNIDGKDVNDVQRTLSCTRNKKGKCVKYAVVLEPHIGGLRFER